MNLLLTPSKKKKKKEKKKKKKKKKKKRPSSQVPILRNENTHYATLFTKGVFGYCLFC